MPSLLEEHTKGLRERGAYYCSVCSCQRISLSLWSVNTKKLRMDGWMRVEKKKKSDIVPKTYTDLSPLPAGLRPPCWGKGLHHVRGL